MTNRDGGDLTAVDEPRERPGGPGWGPSRGTDRIAVLYVDDDPGDVERVADALPAEDDRLAVRSEPDVDAALDRLEGVDCVVSEHRPPAVDGPALLEAVRERYPELPFVLFTGDGSESLARSVLSSGADYLPRDGPGALTVLADRVVTAVECRRERRALLRRSELFERTLRMASVGGWEYDVRAGTVRWTEEVARIHGVEADYEPTLESAIEFYHPEDRPKIREAFAATIEDGEPYDLELRILTGDEVRWVETRGERQTEDGQPAYVRGSIRDVTDRKRQERRLRENKATIEALHRGAPAITAAENAEAVAERTVEAAASLLDFRMCSVLLYQDGWLVPAALSEGAPHGGAERRYADDEGEGGLAGKTYRTGESYVIDRIRPDDEDVDPAKEEYRSGISVAVGDHGVFQAVSTEVEAFDEDDIELAELLVAYAASALDRIDREKELRRQNDRLDQFARVVSHDLRNPIEVIQAEVSLARDAGDLSRLDRIEDALGRMERIIEDLLTLGRAGRRVGDLVPVDLAAVVRESWATVDTGSAELVVEVGDRFLEADRSRLRQALANLFRNAVQHGGEDVTVRVGPTDEGFYVEDDGPGIDPDERESVLDPGYTTDDDGTGLGLAIVRGIVDAHGWDIAVSEAAEGGARFDIDTGQ